MTRDDIIRMAREAKLLPEWLDLCQKDEDALVRFATLVYEHTWKEAGIAATRTVLDAAVLEEREACAKVCEDFEGPHRYVDDIADAIRARSNT